MVLRREGGMVIIFTTKLEVDRSTVRDCGEDGDSDDSVSRLS